MPAGLAAQQALAATATAERSGHGPNFLFMIADDLTFRSIRAINNPEIHAPNLDRLAASGSVFTRCLHQDSWPAAVCRPSRTMLNAGLTTFRAQYRADDVQTWGQTLGAVGYDT